jgi:SAM-dependent methyltransferase
LADKGLMNAFDADGGVPYFSPMLRDQIEGTIDSWAIRWTAASVLHGRMNLFPRVSLSKHMGFGEGATHETGELDYNKELRIADRPNPVKAVEVMETPEALAQWVNYAKRNFERTGGTSLKGRVWRVLPQGVKQWYVRQRSTTGASPKALEFEPVSRVFGIDRGKPVDRYYIEAFLRSERALITGHVMEIEDALYTRMFGTGAVNAEVLRYSGEGGPSIRIGDLTKQESLPSGELDAFICTQTLNFIYELESAVQGIHHALKPGGHALVSVAGLVQISRYDADRWGDLWRFTPQSAQRLFGDVFGADNVEVTTYGNSYAAACLMKGFATEECDAALLEKVDADYPVVITILAQKRS